MFSFILFKGIWMWARPLTVGMRSGENLNVIVLDSEGLASLQVDHNHDLRIFALILLISSQLIYNSVGVIDENSIQNLGLVINLSKQIHYKKGTGIDQVKDFEKYFPEFFWVIRDFILQLQDEKGNIISDNEYLERSLNVRKDQASDEVRKMFCK